MRKLNLSTSACSSEEMEDEVVVVWAEFDGVGSDVAIAGSDVVAEEVGIGEEEVIASDWMRTVSR